MTYIIPLSFKRKIGPFLDTGRLLTSFIGFDSDAGPLAWQTGA